MVGVQDMVREVRLAWIDAAVTADRTDKVRVLPEEEFWGKWSTKTMTKEEKKETLLKIWPQADLHRFYNEALDFAKAHRKKEPKREEAQTLLGRYNDDTCRLFQLPPQKKFEKLRPAGWPAYCSAAVTLSWLIFKAHVDRAADQEAPLEEAEPWGVRQRQQHEAAVVICTDTQDCIIRKICCCTESISYMSTVSNVHLLCHCCREILFDRRCLLWNHVKSVESIDWSQLDMLLLEPNDSSNFLRIFF